MTFPLLCLLVSLLFEVNCAHHPFHKRISNSKAWPILPTPPNNKQDLEEALQILNFGKKTAGLITEDPDTLRELVNNPNLKIKSEHAQKLARNFQKINLQVPIGREYISVSGKNGKLKLENFTKVTPDPRARPVAAGDGNNVQDVFKMIMEKKTPERKHKKFHKITIIQSNNLKPSSSRELKHPFHFRHRKKKHKNRRHDREIRTRFSPLLYLFNDKSSSSTHEQISDETFKQNDENAGTELLVIKLFGKKTTTRIPLGVESIRGSLLANTNLSDTSSLKVQTDIYQENTKSWTSNSKLEEHATEGTKKTISTESIFDEEIFEKFIDSIGLGGFNRKIPQKVAPTRNVPDHRREESSLMVTQKTLPRTTPESYVTLANKKLDLLPPLGVERYALVERILPLEREKDTSISNIFGIAGIMSMALMCFITILIVYSKLHRDSPPEKAAPETSKELMKPLPPKDIVKLQQSRPFPYAGMYYYRTVALDDEDEIPSADLEWQSEVGDWLADQEDKSLL
ncbi:uncharacterized protein TNIN_66881 [Trichonephila inaurata madagascariensis]|uniref:Uncharacterized protein n=1 Tax=Trichonephila inaurata madagascariensis TaxID=2747483 RepID=A0A8X7BW55_9ARAC|nr:uncharacterized protein TNIN_66881 [Trichonephila inaurata madagascariensis]